MDSVRSVYGGLYGRCTQGRTTGEQEQRCTRTSAPSAAVAEGLFATLLSVMRLREPTTRGRTPTGDQQMDN